MFLLAYYTLQQLFHLDIYHAECPPSIIRSDAVMNELASDIRKTAAPLD